MTDTLAIQLAEPTPPSPELAQRLIAFYRGQPDDDHARSDIWCYEGPEPIALRQALAAGNVEDVQQRLATSHCSDIVQGVDHRSTWDRLDQFRGSIQALATSIGILPAINPEQPHIIDTSDEALAALLTPIEMHLGMKLDHPGKCGGMPLVAIAGRLIPPHMLEAACTLVSIQRLGVWDESFTTMEIGAGAGHLCALMASCTTTPYHIVDLPMMAVFQAYVLACYGFEDRLWFSGEPVAKDKTLRIHGLHTNGLPSPVSLIINQNSLPEMPIGEARRYLGLLPTLCKGGIFFSVNHESNAGGQVRVHDIMRGMDGMDRIMRLIHRAPYWGRAGYVEEVWERL